MATRKKDEPNPFSFKNFVRHKDDDVGFGSDDDEPFPEMSSAAPLAPPKASVKKKTGKAKPKSMELPFDDVDDLDLTPGVSGVEPKNG